VCYDPKGGVFSNQAYIQEVRIHFCFIGYFWRTAETTFRPIYPNAFDKHQDIIFTFNVKLIGAKPYYDDLVCALVHAATCDGVMESIGLNRPPVLSPALESADHRWHRCLHQGAAWLPVTSLVTLWRNATVSSAATTHAMIAVAIILSLATLVYIDNLLPTK